MIHILLVDDHPAIMEGTRMILEQEGDMKVSLASNAERALEMACCNHFEMMLFDLHIMESNGIELAKQVLMAKPEAIILIYTGFEVSNHFNLMIEAGVYGFVLKTTNREQLVTSVRCALRGDVVLPIGLVKQLRRNALQLSQIKDDHEALAISSKEHIILKEIARGRNNKEIAERIMMSQRSLEYSLTSLFHKLNVKSRIEAAMKAKQMGLLTDSDFMQGGTLAK